MRGARGVDVGNEAFEGLQLLAFTGAEDAIEDAHAGAQPTGGRRPDSGGWPPATNCDGAAHPGRPRPGMPRSGCAASAAPVVTTSSTTSTRDRAGPPGPKRRTDEAIGTRLARLRRAVGPVQQPPARDAELTGDGAGDGFGLVVPAAAHAASAGRRPGDDVDMGETAVGAPSARRARPQPTGGGGTSAPRSARGHALERNAAAMPSGLPIGTGHADRAAANEKRQRWQSVSPGHPQAHSSVAEQHRPEVNMVESVPGGCDAASR